jgi:hypothetical protein
MSNSPLHDSACLIDVFVCGLARIDNLGGASRLIFHVVHPADGSTPGTAPVITAATALVLPTEMLAVIARQLANPAEVNGVSNLRPVDNCLH